MVFFNSNIFWAGLHNNTSFDSIYFDLTEFKLKHSYTQLRTNLIKRIYMMLISRENASNSLELDNKIYFNIITIRMFKYVDSLITFRELNDTLGRDVTE